MKTATKCCVLETSVRDEQAFAHGGEEMVMEMLQEHVPLLLLLDLTDPAGPGSAEILQEEGAPESRWWER
jgi:hypothetical protein